MLGDGEAVKSARDGWFAVLAAVISLLPAPAAAIPVASYYFRDFSVTFYPLRLFAAREIAAGRWPFWNPYIFGGAPVLPVLYPPELLHVLWPGPAAVSFLLTLHLPLASVLAFALARELGADRHGALVTGAVYSLGGLALSSLNLYVFLEALALAPGLVLCLQRAARRGGRAIALAALVLGLSVTTLAVEFVAQALVLGVALGLATDRGLRCVARLALAAAVGLALAGVPLAVVAGMVQETVRGGGFAADVALANSVHPFALLQAIVPGLFGRLSAPAEVWWGGRFFSKGLPYFLSLYVGPLSLGLAAAGTSRLPRPQRFVLLGLAALGVLYALGPWGGLASLGQQLPFVRIFRFPSKALLLPHLTVAVLAGLGMTALRRGEGQARLVAGLGVCGLLALGIAAGVVLFPGASAAWADLSAPAFAAVAPEVRAESLVAALVAGVGLVAALALRRNWLAPGPALLALGVSLLLDLTRAGAGMNPQVAPAYFDALPELAAFHLDRIDGGRVFSYGLDWSPAFHRFMPRAGARLGFFTFFLNRQLLAPYANLLDRVEAPEAKDLTSFVPWPPELLPEDYDPRAFERIVPRLRRASVSRVLSLDALESSDLQLLGSVPLGAPDLVARVYALRGAWPRASLACRSRAAAGPDDAWGRAGEGGFDDEREVYLEEPLRLSCSVGTVLSRDSLPGLERYEVDADGRALLVTRDSFARGWRAWVNGRSVGVLRANGRHRAVPVPAGRSRVELRYAPPGLGLGLLLMTMGGLLTSWLAGWPILRAELDR